LLLVEVLHRGKVVTIEVGSFYIAFWFKTVPFDVYVIVFRLSFGTGKNVKTTRKLFFYQK